MELCPETINFFLLTGRPDGTFLSSVKDLLVEINVLKIFKVP